jgi:CysZ protein
MSDLRSGARGFTDGVGSIFRAVGFIVRTPSAWLPSLVPAAALVVLSCTGVYVAIAFATPAIVVRLPMSGSGGVIAAVLRAVTAAVTSASAVLLSVWAAPMVSGPALERIVVLRERSLGLPERPQVSFFREVFSGVAAGLFALAVGAPIMASLWFVTLVFPPAAVVTLPLKFATALVLLVLSLVDYPLSLRGLSVRDRLALLGGEIPALAGFGLGAIVLFMIPLGAIVLLPAAVAAATEISAREQKNPPRPPRLPV